MAAPPKRTMRHLSPLGAGRTAPASRSARAPATEGTKESSGATETTSVKLQKGDVFASRYRIESEVGRGGMGSVFAAYDTKLGRRLALKVIDIEDRRGYDARARFLREASLTRQLSGPAFVDVYDQGIHGGQAYLTMELLEGETLLERLRREGAMPIPDVIALVRDVASGLRVAHALQIVHRDLKPSNVFIARISGKSSGVRPVDGRSEAVKILDFGIAKDTWDDARLTRPDVMLGSPFYMSPEQIQSGRDVDPRSDLWSLGVIVFLAITGKLPFRGTPVEVVTAIINDEPPSATSFRPELPSAVDRFFQRALAKRPGLRFDTVDELCEALERAFRPEAEEPEASDGRETIPASIPVPPKPGGPVRAVVSRASEGVVVTWEPRPASVPDAVAEVTRETLDAIVAPRVAPAPEVRSALATRAVAKAPASSRGRVFAGIFVALLLLVAVGVVVAIVRAVHGP